MHDSGSRGGKISEGKPQSTIAMKLGECLVQRRVETCLG